MPFTGSATDPNTGPLLLLLGVTPPSIAPWSSR
jgi:hypothetical protein